MIFQKNHLKEVGETYFEHMIETWKIVWRCQLAVLFQILHGIFPFFCPPLQTDVDSLSRFLVKKSPKNRKLLKS